MKRVLSLICMSAIFSSLPLGTASADLKNCPYATTSKCVNWFRQGVSDGQWLAENDRFWQYYGDLQPYKEPLSLKLRLLTGDDSLHVINGKGEQNHFPTRLMYAYKESTCTMEIGGRCYGNINYETEMGFETVAHGETYRVNMNAFTSGSEYFRTTRFCTYIDNESTCRSIRHRR